MTPLLVPLSYMAIHVPVFPEKEADLSSKLYVVNSMVMNHLKLTDFPEEWLVQDSEASPPVDIDYDPADATIVANDDSPPLIYRVPGAIQAAVILMVTELYQSRESSTANLFSRTVLDLLSPYRDPTIA